MNIERLKKLLEGVRKGEVGVEEALERLKVLPFEEIGPATIDSHRHLRQGFPEVIMGEGKDAETIAAIVERMIERGENILVTRLNREKADLLLKRFPGGRYNEMGRTFTHLTHRVEKKGKGKILVVSAGTSDMPVAEEAVTTCEIMGNEVERLYDVGVAGIHRLFNQKERLFSARVIIVVAGMEGALPSVVGGIVDKPVIAVPTSVGYGAHFGGIASLLAMLNSCASGVAVVNIDNGFGAGYVASLINRL